VGLKINERLNLYICEHGCHNVTADVHEGVTPFMIRCNFKGRPDRPLNPDKTKDGRCIGTARSCMYPREVEDGYPMPVPTHEWYKPTLKEAKKQDKKWPGSMDHYKNGGLSLRERTNVEILKHKDAR